MVCVKFDTKKMFGPLKKTPPYPITLTGLLNCWSTLDFSLLSLSEGPHRRVSAFGLARLMQGMGHRIALAAELS